MEAQRLPSDSRLEAIKKNILHLIPCPREFKILGLQSETSVVKLVAPVDSAPQSSRELQTSLRKASSFHSGFFLLGITEICL